MSRRYSRRNPATVAQRPCRAAPRLETLEPRLLLSASISGTVFDDSNANGVQDGGETGVVGAVVFLDLNNNGVADDGEPTAITDGDGIYLFEGLPARQYTVQQLIDGPTLLTAPDRDLGGTGLVSFNSAITDGTDGLDGLNGVRDAVASPDGLFIYAASADNDTVAVFARDPATGAITTVQIIEDNQGGVSFLRLPNAIAMSADGQFVYVSGQLDRAITQFSRDAGTGLLTYVAEVRHNVGGVVGMDNPSGIVLSADGGSAYVTGSSSTLVVFDRDPVTGALSYVQTITDNQDGVDGLGNLVNTTSVAVSPDGAHVYAAGTSDSAVAIFSRDTNTSELTFVDVFSNGQEGTIGLSNLQSVTVSHDNQNVYVVSSNNGLFVFERDTDTGLLTFQERLANGQDGVSGLFDVKDVAVSPDGAGVYVAGGQGASTDGLTVFTRDPATGLLTFVEHKGSGDGIPGLDGKVGLLFTGGGEFIYVVAKDDDALTLFARDLADNTIEFVNSFADGDGGVDGLSRVFSLILSPDDRFAYATAGADDSVSAFSRDPQTGALTFLQKFQDGVDIPEGLEHARLSEMSPDGRFIYTVTTITRHLVVLERDLDTGLLSFVHSLQNGVGGVIGLQQAEALTVSPDGKNVYTVSRGDNRLTAFSRDPDTGMVTFLESYINGQDGVEGMPTPTDAVVSPDGKRLYASNYFDATIAVFIRDTDTGALTFDKFYIDEDAFIQIPNGIVVDGIRNVEPVVFSPDGRFAVAVGFSELAVFAYDSDTHELTHVDFIENGSQLSAGSDAQSTAFSADGRFFYVANNNNFISVFSFNTETGDIEFVQRLNSSLVSGQFKRPDNLAVSADGRHVYSVSSEGNEIAILDRDGIPFIHTVNVIAGDAITGLDFGNHTSVVSLATDNANAAEEGSVPAVFTVSIPVALDAALVVHYSITGTATNGVDYNALSGMVTIPAGQTSAQIIVTPIDDAVVEGDETVIITLSANDDYELGDTIQGTATIADDDFIPTVSITAIADTAAEENEVEAVIRISIPGARDGATVVHYTIGGTATNGVDYHALPGTATIPAGQTFVDVTITPVDDDEDEDDETVTLTLDADAGYVVGAENQATVTIEDNDGGIIIEGRAKAQFIDADGDEVTISLSGPGTAQVVVDAEGNADATRLVLTGVTSKSKLTIKTKGGGGFTTIGDIVVNGSLGNFSAKTLNLLGDFTVTGFIKSLELGDIADNHVITIGAPESAKDTVSMKLGRVTNTEIHSDTPIKKLDVIEWQDTDDDPDTINAPWVGKVSSKGDRKAGVAGDLFVGFNLTDPTPKTTLAGVKANGALGGTWQVDGAGGKIDAAEIDANWDATFTGAVAGVSSKGDAAGRFEALALKSYAAKGDMVNAQLVLNQLPDERGRALALGKLDVKGLAQNLQVRAKGHIGNASFGLLFDSTIFAGMVDALADALPTIAAQFEHQESMIKSVKVNGNRDAPAWFGNSFLAAGNMGKVTFGFAEIDNAGVACGIAGRTIKGITYKDDENRIRASKPADIAALPPFGDIEVRII